MPEAINYLDTLWYYNLRYSNGKKFFPYYEKLSQEEKELIDFDPEYKVLSAEDASFQALKRGIIPGFPSLEKKFFAPHEEDFYRFTAKYYHKGWLLYLWLTRTLQGKNFLKESKYFIKSLGVKKMNLYTRTFSYPVADTVLPENLNISVVIPTLNRYEYLKDLLNDLSSQSRLPSEIIIIDQSTPFQKEFYSQFPDLPIQVILQKEKGQWTARNKAVETSTGEFILFTDDDSRVNPDWIENHLKCLYYFSADISAGISINEGSQPGKDKNFFHLAEEFDSGNAMARRKVFEAIGMFDLTFDGYRMGDTEFGLRAFLEGLKSVSNPIAGRIHVKAKKGGMRFWGSEKAFKPVSFFGSRPDPGTLYLFRRYYDKKNVFTFLLPRILISYTPSDLKRNVLGWLTGFIGFIVFSPFWYSKLISNIKKVRRMKPQIHFLVSEPRKTL